MSTKTISIVALSEMVNNQEADLFVLMTAKEELTTRDGKPYFKVGFRDGRRQVSFPVWADSPWAVDCRDQWTPGTCYKLRATYRDTNYGPQLEIRKIRPATPADAADGFDELAFQPRSRFEPREMFEELLSLAQNRIDDRELAALVADILQRYREQIFKLPAAAYNHHAYTAGFLEHVLSVTRTCIYLAEKYDDYYPDLKPPLNKGLVVAGGILHDIGKLRELDPQPQATSYTPEGYLIGHILQGRDIVREAAAGRNLAPDVLLRLEHIIVSHQRLPEWGSPKPPMTPEALLVHYADDLDAKYNMLCNALADDANPGPFTSSKNPLGNRIYRGNGE